MSIDKSKIFPTNCKKHNLQVGEICLQCMVTEIKRSVPRTKYSAGTDVDNIRYTSGKSNAQTRNIIWDITFLQWKTLVLNKVCIYCQGKLPKSGCGLDRKDNDIGYLLDNVVPCCGSCNRLKSDILSFDEMIEVTKLLKKMRGLT